MKRLTDVAYWDSAWQARKKPQRLWLYRDFDFETVRLLRAQGGAGSIRVLEVGAGGSRVLPYLGRKFVYRVFGSDFSWPGCRLLAANLALQGIPGAVVCQDLFQSALPDAHFDLVFSSGLVEHFDDTRMVVEEHARMLAPNGRLVLIVPNFQGIQGRIWKRLARPLWERHRVFGPEDLAAILKALGLEAVRSGYLGSFFIRVGADAQWTGLSRLPSWFRKGLHVSVRIVNGLISFGFRLSPVRPHSRALSPAFFASGVKPS
jgi:SAM-dependent methyltransferase